MALQEMLQNLGGFQSLAANAQQMQRQEEQSANTRKASELLRQYRQSAQSGKPDNNALNEAILLSPELSQHYMSALGLQDKQMQQSAANDLTMLYQSMGDEQQFKDTSKKLINSYLAAGRSPDSILDVVEAYRVGGQKSAIEKVKPYAAAFVNQGLIKPELVGFGQAEKQAPMQQGQGEMAGYVFDPNTGKFTVDQAARQAYIDAKAKQDAGEPLGLKDMVTLNKEISAITKDATMIHRTAQDLDKLSQIKSGPAAISMVYKFMKSLDPTSVVREGEFATAERAAGVPDTVLNYYNRLVNGERLPDSVIADFVSTSKQLANTAVDSAEVEVNDYLNTFGDKFDKGFAQRLKARVPKRFEVGEKTVNWGDL